MEISKIKSREASLESISISVVIPIYGYEESLEELYERLNKTLITITSSFEIIMVNDASPDRSWEIISRLAEKDNKLKGVNLSRNFGQHHAITAGIDLARGDWVVVMDCDLQDQPEEIVKLYQTAINNYDIVVAKREQRKDIWIKRFVSLIFYKLFNYLSDINHDATVANFGIYSRKVINSFKCHREQSRSFGTMVTFLGFKRIAIPIEHAPRGGESSSYNFNSRLRLAINTIVSHSDKPLRLSIKLGFILSFLALAYGGWLIIKYLMNGISVPGWTSVMVSIYFLAGLMFINLGFLGLYIGKIFSETKGRPLYIIQNTCNLEGNQQT